MTKAQAESGLRRIMCSGRLPDQFDLRLAHVYADFLGRDLPNEYLKAVIQRRRILMTSVEHYEAQRKAKRA